MKILIIGAAGMIGMRLAKSIVKDDFMEELMILPCLMSFRQKLKEIKAHIK
jgi:malate/lactate dehydrogenase